MRIRHGKSGLTKTAFQQSRGRRTVQAAPVTCRIDGKEGRKVNVANVGCLRGRRLLHPGNRTCAGLTGRGRPWAKKNPTIPCASQRLTPVTLNLVLVLAFDAIAGA